jgi:hypothetical protein
MWCALKGFCNRTRSARRRMYAIQRMTASQRHEQQTETGQPRTSRLRYDWTPGMAVERLGGRGCRLICRLEPSVGASQKQAAMKIRIARGERRRAHDVSIPIIDGWRTGRCLGSQPGAKVSMMIMRPPQHGQGHGTPG